MKRLVLFVLLISIANVFCGKDDSGTTTSTTN